MRNLERQSLQQDEKESTRALFIEPHEAQNFLHEIVQHSQTSKQKNSLKPHRILFVLGFLGGLFVSFVGIFFSFLSIYFIEHFILEKPNIVYQRIICEKK
jgi:hypothetical protein